MNVVVTGSAGRVGSKVVARLLAQGHQVTGFDLRPLGLAQDSYREVVGTFDDAAAATQALDGAQVLIHLGAFMSWLPADAERLFCANVEGTRVLLAAAAAGGVKRLVFASSGEVYPEGAPKHSPIDETHPLEPRSPYGLTKLLGEELVRFYGRTASMAFTILRFSHTQDAAELLDPDSFFSGPRFFVEPKIRQQQGFGNQAAVAALQKVADGGEALFIACSESGRPYRMHITDTRDMVDGVLLAFEKDAAIGETFNLGATLPVDFDVAVGSMARATGLPLHCVNLPGAGIYYETSNARIRERLDYAPQWTMARMIEEAAAAREVRRGG
jgi:UDP-glucose 4-epimerase